ncbi:MAG: hypothetical protein ONB43_27250 [candidate division KSB1 bacterium]|nr:hypothetical protein [candidate division KSB1 bacterium]
MVVSFICVCKNVRTRLDELGPDDRTTFFGELPAPVTQRSLMIIARRIKNCTAD